MAGNIYNRAEAIDANFAAFLDGWSGRSERTVTGGAPVRPGAPMSARELREIFESQVVSRHLDLISRKLRAEGRSYYTIGSSGHEGNAVLGRLTRPTDPAFLHYRSGAFMAERARYRPEIDVVYDSMLSLMAAVDDPISGGRHKVWGSVPMWVLPQTSTIASHVPKAMGMAVGIRRAHKIGIDPPVPRDSIVVCSFGDASLSHSTALGAIGAAQRAVLHDVSCPLLLVCEDNGLGISLRTPSGWVAAAFGSRPRLTYYRTDGLDVIEAHRVAREAIDHCRRERRPVFLHFEVVRLMGHAGSDVELEYRTLREVEATEARDPLLATARTALESGVMAVAEIRELYERIRARVEAAAEQAAARPRLSSAPEIIRPMAPLSRGQVASEARKTGDPYRRIEVFGSEKALPEMLPPRHLAAQINAALHDLMVSYPEAVVFGEDVADKGGVYNVTTGLLKRFGAPRVFNTIVDESTIFGIAQGFGFSGMLPIPEIQYLAYFHNACDQIRGEACSMQFFSNGQFRNPMVIRIASLGYQKGFGGHFHNDNSITALRDIPGLIIACPSRGDDAAGMLRTCAALARTDGRVVAFLEPIALYMTKDLHRPKDGEWLFPYPAPGSAVPFGEARVYGGQNANLLIVTYGNGVHLSLQAAERIRARGGPALRVLDLRWLQPLAVETIARHAAECGRVVVVDEGRRSGGIAEAIVTSLVEAGQGHLPMRRVAGEDTYIPLGPAAELVLPSVEGIVESALSLAKVAGGGGPAATARSSTSRRPGSRGRA